jgi:hypothetical protein
MQFNNGGVCMLTDLKHKNANVARERALWGDIMVLGMVFPIAITVAFYLGRWVGELLGYPKTGIAIGLVWGVATGFFELYRVTVRLNGLDKINEIDSNHGDGHGTFK